MVKLANKHTTKIHLAAESKNAIGSESKIFLLAVVQNVLAEHDMLETCQANSIGQSR